LGAVKHLAQSLIGITLIGLANTVMNSNRLGRWKIRGLNTVALTDFLLSSHDFQPGASHGENKGGVGFWGSAQRLP
jgi:hypothetical protein